MRSALVYYQEKKAGLIKEIGAGYSFQYNAEYISNSENIEISKTLPIKPDEYVNPILFPFFDGLIPEGWVLDIVEENWKLNPKDRFGIMLKSCKDCIGAVSIIEIEE
jgi:serine/threonine-protein kinase HipA